MIRYDNLWITLNNKGITQYMLIHTYHISSGQLNRMKHNKNVSTHTIDMLCAILDCSVSDVMEDYPDI